MPNDKILIIEDEKDLVKLLKYNLEKEGYQVVVALDGEAGLAQFRKEKPQLILLDVMLPKMHGYEVCKAVRLESKIPILMLTAKREEVDKILGLELGADDYVTKPFSVREVLARVKAILRRTPGQEAVNSSLRLGKLEIDMDRYEVRVAGKDLSLSTKEFDLLKCLIQAQGRVLTREQLLEKVWGVEKSADIDTRTIDQHVARLRDKLGPEADAVSTVKNVGYKFVRKQK